MDALKLLADTNVKIGEARGILIELQNTETIYLQEREQKTVVKIQEILDSSKEIVAEINGNYEQVQHFYNTVVSYVEFLSKIQDEFSVMMKEFDEHSQLWEKQAFIEQTRLDTISKDLKLQSERIEREKGDIETARQSISKEKRLIESRQKQIKSALVVLKQKENGR